MNPLESNYAIAIRNRALEESRQEDFRAQVELYKEKMRACKWWHKYIPFTIKIERRK